ncbi:MAG: hypothetical protein KatS3mg042_1137 [Rhodothermaceae bacterium]|nr:MAG: hypothetical protein KatS3mg042_1137 [Rhodothermaceae bacterium]
MNRREAIKRVGLLFGGVLYAPAVAGLLSGCRSGGEAAFTPRTLTPEQNDLVIHLTEMIIPETDTPGAKAARVNEFVDLILTDWAPAEDRDRFLAGLADVEARSQAAYQVAFLEATPEQQVALLTQLEDEALAAPAPPDAQPFFLMLKQLTLLGYYTSEIGATQELQWLAAPGRYDGCAPLEEVGRTWA